MNDVHEHGFVFHQQKEIAPHHICEMPTESKAGDRDSEILTIILDPHPPEKKGEHAVRKDRKGFIFPVEY